MYPGAERLARNVSIPSSSGHQFTARPVPRRIFRPYDRFQSLLHQGISLLIAPDAVPPNVMLISFNPFFIRASVYWQALTKPPRIAIRSVSIPSSSGHQFTARICRRDAMSRVTVSIPSSSGHQFTGVLARAGLLAGIEGFNPFFIRASVYWDAEVREAIRIYVQCFNPFFIRASVYCLCMAYGRVRDDAFQSLLHQGISLLSATCFGHALTCWLCFNPFFIRASVY